MCQCFYCTKGQAVTPPGCQSFEEFVDLTYVKCKLGHKTGCNYCRDFCDVDKKKKGSRKHG